MRKKKAFPLKKSISIRFKYIRPTCSQYVDLIDCSTSISIRQILNEWFGLDSDKIQIMKETQLDSRLREALEFICLTKIL